MFPLPLTITISPSGQLRHGLLGLHGISLAAIWLAYWPVPLQALLSLILLASTGWQLRPAQPVLLRCHRNGQLALKKTDTWTPFILDRQQTVMPGLALLHYRPAGSRRSQRLPVLADSLPPEDFRRLRVWLRWVARPEGQTKGLDTRT